MVKRLMRSNKDLFHTSVPGQLENRNVFDMQQQRPIYMSICLYGTYHTSHGSRSGCRRLVRKKLCSAAKVTTKSHYQLYVGLKSKLTQRMVSQRTKDLIKKKKCLRKDKKALKEVKKETKESCLMDFQTWVKHTVVDIEKTNEMGTSENFSTWYTYSQINPINHQE